MKDPNKKLIECFVQNALKNSSDIRQVYALFPSLPKNAPWCSIFLFWAAKEAGITTLPDKQNVPMARSWLSIGKKKETPEMGDVVILKRGQNPMTGHVGLFCRFTEKEVCLLGGNQGGRVSFSFFSQNDILGFREIL